jgi:hypothetical protein
MQMRERWQQINELFDLAVELRRAERTPFLDERCSDPDVRAEVERLLRQHDASGILDHPVRSEN